MIYLNNELLTSNGIINYVNKNIDLLKQPKAKRDSRPSNLEQFQKKLRSVFFEGALTNEDVLNKLESDDRFDTYPKLKEILEKLLSIKNPVEINQALVSDKSDWHFSLEKFNELNDIYGYFPDENDELRALFENLTLACRCQIVFFEKNNNTADDNIAYDYAYKLMALFIKKDKNYTIPQNLYNLIYNLMNNAEGDKAHPLHEALMVKLNTLPHASTLKDRSGWVDFVIKESIKSLPYLLEARNIESQMAILNSGEKKAPKNLSQANKMWMLHQYSRADEDPSFAELCHRYKVSEERFNQCLDYMSSGWPKKTGDNIPNLKIEGQDEASNLLWVKLPLGDKRALILGDITDCCQSIGGNSEQCVKDAVSLNHNALYVLLKRKKSNSKNIIVNGEINEKDFKIIGQSYVWKSALGNICLDSLECLNREVSFEAQKSILSEFAQTCLEQDPNMKCVTLGTGGKTPDSIFEDATISELMREGVNYGDANQQYCISLKKAPDIAEYNVLREIFKFNDSYQSDYLFAYAIPHTDGFFETLKHLCLTGEKASENQELINENIINPESFSALIMIFKLGLLSGDSAQDNFQKVIRYFDSSTKASSLGILYSKGLLSGEFGQENFNTFLKLSSDHIDAISYHITNDLFTGEFRQDNFDAICKSRYPDKIIEALNTLQSSGLLNGTVGHQFHEIVCNHSNPGDFAIILQYLNTAGMLTGDSIELVLQKVSQSKVLSDVVDILKTFSAAGLFVGDSAQENFHNIFSYLDLIKSESIPKKLNSLDFLDEEDRKMNYNFVTNSSNQYIAATILEELNKAGLLTGDSSQHNRTFVDLSIGISRFYFLYLLKVLNSANLLNGDLSQKNFDSISLIKDKKNAYLVFQNLYALGLLTGNSAQENFKLVCDCQELNSVSKLIRTLQSTSFLKRDAAQENIQMLLKHKDIRYISDVLSILNSTGLLSGKSAQSNFDIVTRDAKASRCYNAINALRDYGLLEGEKAQANFEAILNNPNPFFVARALRSLNSGGLLSGDSAQANRDAVAKHAHPEKVAWALRNLHSVELLSGNFGQTIRDAVSKHSNPQEMSKMILELNNAGLLSGNSAQKNLDAFLKSSNPQEMAKMMLELNNAGLLSGNSVEENLHLISTHGLPVLMCGVLELINQIGLLSGGLAQQNLELVSKYKPLILLKVALSTLVSTNLLTGEYGQEIFNSLCNSSKPNILASIFKLLNEWELLTGKFAKSNLAAVMDKVPNEFSNQIQILASNNCLNQDEFNKLVSILPSVKKSNLSFFTPNEKVIDEVETFNPKRKN